MILRRLWSTLVITSLMKKSSVDFFLVDETLQISLECCG